MKHAFIAPINYLHLIPEESNYHLILTHLLGDPTYAAFYRAKEERGDFIILDNSAFEFKKPLSIQEMGLACKRANICPNIVVAPDYPFQVAKETIESAKGAARIFSQHFDVNKAKLMVVPQSKEFDYKDFIYGVEALSEIDLVSFIGMSILGVPNAFKKLTESKSISVNRLYAINHMESILEKSGKSVHLLGMGDDIREITYYKQPFIVGNDSSSAIWHGINGIAYDINHPHLLRDGKIDKEVDFHITGDQGTEICKFNIKTLQSLLG